MIRHDVVALRQGVSVPSAYFRDAVGNYHALDCRGCLIEQLAEALRRIGDDHDDLTGYAGAGDFARATLRDARL